MAVRRAGVARLGHERAPYATPAAACYRPGMQPVACGLPTTHLPSTSRAVIDDAPQLQGRLLSCTPRLTAPAAPAIVVPTSSTANSDARTCARAGFNALFRSVVHVRRTPGAPRWRLLLERQMPCRADQVVLG